jgi:hypothetical protein
VLLYPRALKIRDTSEINVLKITEKILASNLTYSLQEENSKNMFQSPGSLHYGGCLCCCTNLEWFELVISDSMMLPNLGLHFEARASCGIHKDYLFH